MLREETIVQNGTATAAVLTVSHRHRRNRSSRTDVTEAERYPSLCPFACVKSRTVEQLNTPCPNRNTWFADSSYGD